MSAPPVWSPGGPPPLAMFAAVDALPAASALSLATRAAQVARLRVPRVTGAGAGSLRPYWGEGFFGVRWSAPYLWYPEAGTRPRTMRSLAGKTVPMWVGDEDGALRRADPKIRTRTTEDGRRQVLIFRRAAQVGQRKTVRRRVAGRQVTTSVPASYPGAPGRIGQRQAGRVATGNVGVRWRYPGTAAAWHVKSAIVEVAAAAGLGTPLVHPAARGA